MVRQVSSRPFAADGADATGLELVAADLTSDDGWSAALEGVEEVHHVASPIPSAQPKDPDELIVPARQGTVRVLKAARDAGARRVVLTSSFAAVGYSPKAVRGLHRGGLDRPRYARAGALPALQGDRRACRLGLHRDRRRRHPAGGGEPDIHRRPVAGAGIALDADYFKAIIEGTMPALPRQRFGVVDVRDVADAHITAMATPAAAGKRYLLLADGPTITWLELAQILRDHLGPAGEHVTTDEAPGEDPAPLTIHNDRAKQELGWHPRPAETTIVETADSLRELGLLGEH